MTSKITAPWTDDEVAALNRFQTCGFVHEFTCIDDHGSASRVLIARRDGWHCPSCGYRQDWAHRFMLQEPVNPFAGTPIQPPNGAEAS